MELAPQEWEGITGRMKQLLDVQERRVEQKIENKVMELDANMREIQVAQGEIQGLLTSIADKMK